MSGIRPRVFVLPTREELADAVAGHVARLSELAIRLQGRFDVALSGGSLMEIVGPALAEDPHRSRINWSAWHVFWADERWAPLTGSESNYGAGEETLFRRVPIPRDQIHGLDGTLGVTEAAEAYANMLAQVLGPGTGGFPKFDLILLGIGEDGHTASLFPGHHLLEETRRWVAPVFNAPKPPPTRITLTLPVLNNARNILIVAAGAGKAKILEMALGPALDRPKIPIQLIAPSEGTVQWFVDALAAGSPTNSKIGEGDQKAMERVNNP